MIYLLIFLFTYNRNFNVIEDDNLGKDINEDDEDVFFGLYCKVVV